MGACNECGKSAGWGQNLCPDCSEQLRIERAQALRDADPQYQAQLVRQKAEDEEMARLLASY
jgi:hypothetical protein